jgi:hypothetical protein
MKKLEKKSDMVISLTGTHHENQDVGGQLGPYFWVLDGATSLWPDVLGGQDVSRTMARIQQQLFSLCADPRSNSLSLKEILRQAVRTVEDQFRREIRGYEDIPSCRLPTFAAAFGRRRGRRLEVLLLADCEIYIPGSWRLTDCRFAPIARANAENMQRIFKEKGLDPASKNIPSQEEEIYLLYERANRTQRRLLNSTAPGGYWVGSLDGCGIAHALTGEVDIEEDVPVYAFCDGFSHLLEACPHLLDGFPEEKELRKTLLRLRALTDDDVTLVRNDRGMESME